jgi:hypothetical protein
VQISEADPGAFATFAHWITLKEVELDGFNLAELTDEQVQPFCKALTKF